MRMPRVTPILTQVPTGHRLVLRNAWVSRFDDPADPKGYSIDSEGWQFWLPLLWHMFVALVDIRPRALDPEAFRVNTVDGQEVDVDVRAVERLKRDSAGKIAKAEVYKVAIQVEAEGGLGRDEIVLQVLTAALNAATSSYPAITYSPDELRRRTAEDGVPGGTIELSPEQEEVKTAIQKQTRLNLDGIHPRYWSWLCRWQITKDAVSGAITSIVVDSAKGLVELTTRELQDLARYIRQLTEEELSKYGLEFTEVKVQSINPAGSLAVALRRRAAAQVEAGTAEREKDYLQTVLQALSAAPAERRIAWEAVVVVANMFADAFRDALGGLQSKARQLPQRPAPRS